MQYFFIKNSEKSKKSQAKSQNKNKSSYFRKNIEKYRTEIRICEFEKVNSIYLRRKAQKTAPISARFRTHRKASTVFFYKSDEIGVDRLLRLGMREAPDVFAELSALRRV